MAVKILGKCTEGEKWGDSLFFNFIKEENDVVTFSFFPRPYNGNDYLKGFAFSINYKELSGWGDFVEKVVLHPEFVECYWKQYRLGFAAEKYWFKLVSEFKQDFDDCPYELSSMNFGRLSLSREMEDRLIQLGVKMEAW